MKKRFSTKANELIYQIRYGSPKKALYDRYEELLYKSISGELNEKQHEELQALTPIFDK